MYTRRPKKQLKFSTGGVVPAEDAPPTEPVDVAVVPEDIAAPSDADDAIRLALQAQQRAEEIAREMARKPPVDPVAEFVDRLDGVSDHKKAFLKANRHMLDASNAEIVPRVYSAALSQGISDDTPEMDEWLLHGVQIERQLMAERMKPAQRAEETPPPMPSLPQTPKMPMGPPPAPRRSVPVSAPVSRDIPSASGRRQSAESQVTLTAEERQIARNSFGGVIDGRPMTNAEKEALYAMNKSRYQQMLANGEYSPQGNR